MKRVFQMLFLIFIVSCSSQQSETDLIADKEFKACSEAKYNHLREFFAKNVNQYVYKQNIHSLLENKLIEEKYLSEISKKGYSELLKKANRKEIKPDFFEKFKKDLGFDPYALFPSNSHLSCYGYLIEQLKISDKSSWQYRFALAYNKHEANGNLKINVDYLIDALNEIPENKFKLLMYRKLFLDIIYSQTN